MEFVFLGGDVTWQSVFCCCFFMDVKDRKGYWKHGKKWLLLKRYPQEMTIIVMWNHFILSSVKHGDYIIVKHKSKYKWYQTKK